MFSQNADHHLAKIRKIYKLFRHELDLEDIKLQSKLEIFTKLNCIGISVLGSGNKEKCSGYELINTF